MKTGYKVVKNLTSSVYKSCTLQPISAYYFLNKETKRPRGCGPLCVFSSKRAAQIFANMYAITSIFKCKYKPSRCKTIWNNGNRRSVEFLPDKTVLAESVTLLSKEK
jgi:hypothetical protein